MNNIEQLAISFVLSKYPSDKSFDEVLENILSPKAEYLVWYPFQTMRSEELVITIQSLKENVERVVEQETKQSVEWAVGLVKDCLKENQ